MRWLVEVTALGSPGENEGATKESLHVDADTWQKALHTARAQRGEPGPMSGFSIELLDEGCRAVDPGSRTRYEVRRASASDVARASVPPPAAQAPVATASVPPPAPAAVAAVAVAPSPAHSSPPRPVSHAPAAPRTRPPGGARADRPRGADPDRGGSAGARGPGDAARRRRGERTLPDRLQARAGRDGGDAPHVPREYVYNVPPLHDRGGGRDALLTTQLEFVRASLERVPAGKLVNLAAVDAPIDARPAPPPLATLTWKDWRGAAVIAFPRRGGARPAPVAAPVAVPAAAPMVAPVAVQTFAPAAPVQPFAPPAPAPAPVAAPVMQAAPVAPAPNPFAPQAAPLPSVVIAQTPPPPPMAVPPVVAPAPLPMRSPTAVAPPAAVPPGHVVPQPFAPAYTPPPPVVRSAPPLKTGGPNGRVRGEDLIADLFPRPSARPPLLEGRASRAESFAWRSRWRSCRRKSAACSTSTTSTTASSLITTTRGAGTGALIMQRFLRERSDPPHGAMQKRKSPGLPRRGVQSEAAAVPRYASVACARSVIVAPVEQAGRFLGALEILNPLDGQPFTEAEGNAVMYIAEQLAEFLSQRGVVTDPEKIAARQAQ